MERISSLGLRQALPAEAAESQALRMESPHFSSSNNITSTNPANNGQILIGSTSSAPVLSTLTAGSNVTITNGPGSITISASGSGGGNPSFPFFVTGGEHTGANQAAAKNVNKLWGFLLPYNVTTTQVTYDVSTVDNTANLYDLGIYNNSGQLVLNIGPTAGTSFAPSKKFLTFNWLQGLHHSSRWSLLHWLYHKLRERLWRGSCRSNLCELRRRSVGRSDRRRDFSVFGDASCRRLEHGKSTDTGDPLMVI